MKTFRLLFCLVWILLAIAACSKDEPAPVVEMLDLQNDSLLLTGMFQTEVHTTSGTVSIYSRDNNKVLVLEDFKTDNGPGLYVYISKDRSVSNSINLGQLRSTSGTFSYQLENSINIEEYPYVLIWCRPFAVLFGSAQLQMP